MSSEPLYHRRGSFQSSPDLFSPNPRWRWITDLGVAAAAITSWLSWPVYRALSRIHYFCRGTDRRITEQPCWLTDRPTWSLEIEVADHQLPIVSRASRPPPPLRSSALRTDIKAPSQLTDVEDIPSITPQLQHWPTVFQRAALGLNVAADLET